MTTILAVRVEGLGRGAYGAGSAGLYRWALEEPFTNDYASVYVSGALVGLPDELGFSCDFRAGRSSVGGLTFQLFAFVEGAPLQPEQAFYTQTPAVHAQLLDGIDEVQTTVRVLASDDLTGETLILGNEAVYFDYVVSGGTYSVLRGVLGTRARAQGIAGAEIRGVDDNELYNANDGPILRGRRVELIEVSSSGSYADEVVLWTGVIDEINHPTPDVIEIGCTSALDHLRDRRLCESLWRGRRIDWRSLGAGGGYASAGYTRVSGLNAYTPRGLFAWGDKGAVINNAPASTAGAALSFSSENTEPLYADGILVNWDEEPPAEVWQLFSTAPQAPPLYGTTRLSNNLATLTLQVLTTTELGGNYDAAGGATDYDLALPNLGAGIDWELVDVGGIERVRAQLGDLLRVDAIHLGTDGKPVKALEWLSSLWRPYGGVVTGGQGGRITVALFTDSLEAGADTELIDVYDLAERVAPTQRRRLADAIDSIAVAYADRPGQEPIIDTFNDVFNRRRQLKAPATSREELDLLGCDDPQLVLDLGSSYIQRYSRPIPELTVQVLGQLDLWPGDLCRVTLGMVSGRSTTQGVDEEVYLVTGRRYRWQGGSRATYALLAVGALYAKRGAWAPTARIASWSSGTSTATCDANAYTTGPGPFATDIEALSRFGTADLLILSAADLSVKATCASTGYGANTITLSGLGSYTPVVGDLLVLRDYPNQGAADAFDAFAVVSDANGDFDGGAGYQWGY